MDDVEDRLIMHRLTLPILLLYLLFTIAFGVVNPIFEAPDEQHHFFNALAIAATGRLPQADKASLARQEAAQPPLYYLLSAAILKLLPIATDSPAVALWSNPYVEPGNFDAVNNYNAFVHTAAEAWPWQEVALGVHILRLFSTGLGIGTLLLIQRSSLLLWPNRKAQALLAMALIAFLPQFEFLHAAVTNDSLIIFLSSAALWQMIRLSINPTGRRWFILGVTIGLAILSKLTGLLLFGCALPLLLLTATRTNAWHRASRDLLLLLIPAVVLSGWLFYRNWLLYGNLTAVNIFIEFGGGDRNFPLWVIYQQLDRIWASAIAIFGWMNVRPPQWIFHLWMMIAGWVVGGAIIALARWTRRQWQALSSPTNQRSALERTLLFAILLSWPIFVTVAWIQFALHTHADQGRLLFPALLPLALVAAHSLVQWRIPLFSGLVLCALLIPPPFIVGYWLPTRYTPVQEYMASTLPENLYSLQQTVNDELELVGGMLKRPVIKPGEAVQMTLFWRKVAESPTPAVTTFEVVGRGYQTIGALPLSYHGGGTAPSTLWPVGATMQEEITIAVDAAAVAPTVGRVWLRLEGKDDLFEIGRVKIIPKAWPTPSTVAIAQIAEQIRIAAVQITPTVSAPGETVTVHLEWQVIHAPVRELSTFVHLGDPTEPPLAQADGPPRQGDYPTALWAAGEVFDDTYSLTIPVELADDAYPIYVGLYDPATGQRQPLWQNGERAVHDGMLAGWLTVQKGR